jgi:SAM-dependent methyltransferase
METLYAERPEVYDALYADKEYDDEVAFVISEFEERGNGGDRVLVVGCGTGEHSRRLVERGFDVTGVDRYEAMVERARTKSDATFHADSLPDLSVEGPYDLAFLPFTVVNHLRHSEVAPSLRSVADVLTDGGLLVFDELPLSEEDRPRMATYDAPDGTYGRLVDVRHVEGDRYRWDSFVVTPDGDAFVDAHEYTNHDPAYLVGVLEGLGLDVTTYEWYDAHEPTDGVDDARVFVARK